MPLDPISRREFLRRSVLLSTIAAGGSVVAACTPGTQDRDQTFSVSQWRTLNAFTEAVVPPGGAFEAGALDAGVPQKLAGMFEAEDPHIRSQVSAGLTFLEWISLPFFGGRFSKLNLDERTAAVNELMRSRWELLRRLARALSQATMFAFYSTEAAWQDIDYHGPWVGAQP